MRPRLAKVDNKHPKAYQPKTTKGFLLYDCTIIKFYFETELKLAQVGLKLN